MKTNMARAAHLLAGKHALVTGGARGIGAAITFARNSIPVLRARTTAQHGHPRAMTKQSAGNGGANPAGSAGDEGMFGCQEM